MPTAHPPHGEDSRATILVLYPKSETRRFPRKVNLAVLPDIATEDEPSANPCLRIRIVFSHQFKKPLVAGDTASSAVRRYTKKPEV